MSERDPDHVPAASGRRWRLLRRAATATALLMLAAAAAAYWLGPPEVTGPEPAAPPAVAPPAGVDLPPPAAAGEVVEELAGEPLRPRRVRRAVRPVTDHPRVGSRFAVVVAGLDGVPVHTQGPDVVVPASTLKLVTALAALQSLGPEHRFSTRVVGRGRQLTLVGGGDPLLVRRRAGGGAHPEPADLATLARRTARALAAEGRTRVRLRYDDTLFTGPVASPHWEEDYLAEDVVSPIVPLWVDQGRRAPGLAERSATPARDAAVAFARELRRRGITVLGAPRRGAERSGAVQLASVTSAELVELVQHVLEVSDNEAAEVLARHVAIAEGEPASFAGAARAVRAVVERLGVTLDGAVIHDASGLARSNRLPVQALLDVLAVAADPAYPDLAGVLAGLPVAGFTGSLSYRFTSGADAGLGKVRAKTGTLTGVHGLAGLAVGSDGAVLLFAAVADRVAVPDTLFVRDRLDQLGAALAACACGAAAAAPRAPLSEAA